MESGEAGRGVQEVCDWKGSSERLHGEDMKEGALRLTVGMVYHAGEAARTKAQRQGLSCSSGKTIW